MNGFMDEKELMEFVYGANWQEKIWKKWNALPWWSRAYWTVRGKHPKRYIEGIT